MADISACADKTAPPLARANARTTVHRLAFGPRFAREPAAGGHQGACGLHPDVTTTVHAVVEGGRHGGSDQRPVRLNFRIIRGRSAPSGNVPPVPSCLV